MTCCLPLFALLGFSLILVKPTDAQIECERLKQTLEYTQEEAPRDFTKVVRTIRADGLHCGRIGLCVHCALAAFASTKHSSTHI
jgi:hypothetical protein